MLLNLSIAALMMVITTAIHTLGMIIAVCPLMSSTKLQVLHLTPVHFQQVGRVVLLMFFASVIEVMVWALVYLLLGAIEGFEKAAYFSMVTYTSLGYGDIVLDERWRLLASFEAVNGIIMFGWTTAIVIAVVQRVYFNK